MGYSNKYPLYNLSLNSGLRYKNFDIDILIQGVSGISKTTVDAFAWPLHRLSNHVFAFEMDAWSPLNRDAKFPSYHFDVNRTHTNISAGAIKTATLYDASYIRLKSVDLGYTLPKTLLKSLGVDNFRIFLRGNNLLTWCPQYPLADPEASDSDGAMVYGYYPMMRRFQLGIKLGF